MHAIILHRDAKIEICVDTVVENHRKVSFYRTASEASKVSRQKMRKKTKNVMSSLRSPLSEMRLFWWFAHTVDLIVGNKRWRNVLKSAYFQPLSVAFNHADHNICPPYGINRRRSKDHPTSTEKQNCWAESKCDRADNPLTKISKGLWKQIEAGAAAPKWHYCQDVFAAACWQLLFSLASHRW